MTLCFCTCVCVCVVVGAENALAADLLSSWKASSGVTGASPSALSRTQSGSGSATPSTPSTPRALPTTPANLPAAPPAAIPPPPPSAPSTPIPAAAPTLVKSSSSGSGARTGSLDVLGESRKRKAEQMQAAAAAAAASGKRISLMPAGAAARPQLDIPYPVALPAHATPPAPCLPSDQAFFARSAPTPAAAASSKPAAAAAPAVRKSLPAARSGPMTTEELRARIRLQLCRAFDAAAAPDATDFANEIVETSAEIEGGQTFCGRGWSGIGFR